MRLKISDNFFKGKTIYTGIDVHLKSWKVTILTEEREHKCFSMDPDPDKLASYLKRLFPGATYLAVYESGFSGFSACRRLKELGIDARVINAADVPSTSKERQQKTDKLDSRKLAKALRNESVSYIHIPDEQLEADRTLVRQRFLFSKEVAKAKNRLKSCLFQYNIGIPERFTKSQSRQWTRAYLDWIANLEVDHPELRMVLDNTVDYGTLLRKQLLKLNRQLRNLSKQERYFNNYQLLLSIPGVGPLTAMLFLVEVGDIARFKKLDHLCSFIGLMPRMYQSADKMVTGKLIKRGRKQLKIGLIEASWKAIDKDPALMSKYEELKTRMHGNKAIIRIARKLLGRIRSILLNQCCYELGVLK